MSQTEILLPKMGESVAEATIVRWILEEGDAFEADDPIIEIATDKVDSEVPAPEAGVLIKKLCDEGDVVEVGKPVAIISTGAGEAAPAPERTAAAAPVQAAGTPSHNGHTAPKPVREPAAVGSESPELVGRTGPSGRFYSPLVRNIAGKEGIGMEELEALEGTGHEGRVTKKDILNYLPKRGESAPATAQPQPEVKADKAPTQTETAQEGTTVIKAPKITVGAEDEIVEMDRMRKLISEHMVTSKHVSPHVTSYVEADVTNLVAWRNKVKDEFERREGEKLTFTPIFIEAIARAIKEMPQINVSTDGQNIIRRKHINVGMAAALPTGNLIVPVIHDADQLNLLGLAKKVNDLAVRARENKLKPEEIQGGTYTVTNVGTFGNVMGTPIINQPQAAIMALGAIRKKPAVIETDQGDFIGVRSMMFLSHAYDHRIIDGALGGSFVRRVADILEQFDPNREI